MVLNIIGGGTMKKYRWNVKKFLTNMTTVLSIITILWLVVSYGEIVYKNLLGTPVVFWKYNLIVLLFGC